MYIANVGDSRTVLCRNGKLRLASQDHKPSRADEEERVHKAGGFVAHRRVRGRDGQGGKNAIVGITRSAQCNVRAAFVLRSGGREGEREYTRNFVTYLDSRVRQTYKICVVLSSFFFLVVGVFFSFSWKMT